MAKCQSVTCGNNCQCSACQNNGCGSCNGCGNWNTCGGCGSCGNWGWGCGGWNGCGGCNNCGSCGGCNNGCWGGCGWNCDQSDWPTTSPMAPGGLLVPRIVASGRVLQRNVSLELCVTDLPECAEGPYNLVSISACGNSDWELLPGSGKQRVMRVTIPVMVTLRDRCGAVYSVHSSITVDVPIRVGLPGQDPCRGMVEVLPGLRLNGPAGCCCGPVCSEDECFDICIDVLVDVYVTRWEPSGDSITAPCRPDLPLTLPMSWPSCR